MSQADVDREKLAKRVKALLAKGNDPACTVEEAEAFLAKAAELMAKYELDSMVAGIDDRPIVDHVIDDWDPQYGYEEMLVYNAVGRAFGVRSVMIVRGRKLHVFGAPSDIDRVEMVFESVMTQLANALSKQVAPDTISKVDYAKNFVAGFSSRVMLRLTEVEERARKQAEADRQAAGGKGKSVALMVVERRDQVERMYRAKYPHTSSSGRARSGAGLFEGDRAGSMADLGGTRVSGGGQRGIGR